MTKALFPLSETLSPKITNDEYGLLPEPWAPACRLVELIIPTVNISDGSKDMMSFCIIWAE